MAWSSQTTLNLNPDNLKLQSALTRNEIIEQEEWDIDYCSIIIIIIIINKGLTLFFLMQIVYLLYLCISLILNIICSCAISQKCQYFSAHTIYKYCSELQCTLKLLLILFLRLGEAVFNSSSVTVL